MAATRLATAVASRSGRTASRGRDDLLDTLRDHPAAHDCFGHRDAHPHHAGALDRHHVRHADALGVLALLRHAPAADARNRNRLLDHLAGSDAVGVRDLLAHPLAAGHAPFLAHHARHPHLLGLEPRAAVGVALGQPVDDRPAGAGLAALVVA